MRKRDAKIKDSEGETPDPPFARLYLELPLSMAERYDRKAKAAVEPGDKVPSFFPFYRYFLDLPFLSGWHNKSRPK